MGTRLYTFTMKACMDCFKGNKELLKLNFTAYLSAIGGTQEQLVFEDEGKRNIHLHALIRCPYIKDKSHYAKLFKGWSTHCEIIKAKDEDMSKYIWFNYINKYVANISDSDRIYECFGNMFI